MTLFALALPLKPTNLPTLAQISQLPREGASELSFFHVLYPCCTRLCHSFLYLSECSVCVSSCMRKQAVLVILFCYPFCTCLCYYFCTCPSIPFVYLCSGIIMLTVHCCVLVCPCLCVVLSYVICRCVRVSVYMWCVYVGVCTV